MLALLLPLVIAGLAVAASSWPTPRGQRESLLRATLVFGAIVVAATETLSLMDAITADVVAALWITLAIGTAFAAVLLRTRRATDTRPDPERTRPPWLLVVGCAAILSPTLLIAMVAPPDHIDVMTYHMGRVAHWIQARSVDYYPTGIRRQNYQMPFAEFVILHLQLLSGGDRFANLVQWTAFALSGLTVSLILAELGQPPRIQLSGGFIALATPLAILEASGAQNDVVAALWLLAFLLYLWRSLSDRTMESAVLCGLALGLALLTKGTAYLYAPSMGTALLLGWCVRSSRGRHLPPLRHWVAALVIASCLNLGPWLRNMSVHGKPICCGETYFVDRLTPGGAYSNVVRNAALHMGVPKLHRVVTRAVEILTPVPFDDPATGIDEGEFELSFSLHEGKAGNTLLFLAALAAMAGIAFDPRLRQVPAVPWIAAASAGFVTFSVALNWQPWASRLHTPVFLAACVPVAILLGTRSGRLWSAALALFFVGSLPYLLLNTSRPLVPMHKPSILTRDRIRQYFIDRPAYLAPYRDAAALVRSSGEPEVGLLFDENAYEYPFWVMVKEDFAGPPILRHVGVTHPPVSDVPLAPPPPRLVVATRRAERRTVDGFDYVRVRDLGVLSILRREGGNVEPAVNHSPAQ